MDWNQSPSLFEPWTWVCYSLVGLLVGLCQAGGIGGGPIISPVIMALFGFSSKKAIWNTYVVLLGGSLGNFLKLGKERTANGESPLINYQLAMITLPLLLSGAIFGVATGKWLPKLLVVSLLFLVLISVFLKTLKVYKKARSMENNVQLVQVELENLLETKRSMELEIIMIQEQRLYPMEMIRELILQVVIVVAITFLKGTQSIPSLIGINYCSFQYHLLNIAIIGIAVLNLCRYKRFIFLDEQKKENCGYKFDNGKMSLAFKTTVRTSLYAGFMGGLVGLGGGVILTPMWLEMGIMSSRAAGTSIFCVMFSASISVFIIGIGGGYHIQEFLILMIFSCMGSYHVASYVKGVVKKLRRESILVLLLLGVISLGLVILPVKSIQNLQQNKQQGFGKFC